MRYVAFLRAVNVGGRGIVKMGELAARLTQLGLKDVKTVIASGNVMFTAPSGSTDALGRKIGADLEAWLGYPVAVMVRTLAELEALVASNPFKGVERAPDARLYVAFLWKEPAAPPRLPLVAKRDGLELFRLAGREGFMVSARLDSGFFGMPNLTIEKALGVPCTTRNWNTVLRMVKSE